MTEEEAIQIASKKAHELNMPWDRTDVQAKLMRLWPFPGTWRIQSRVKAESSQSTILVNVRTREAVPRSVRVERRFGLGGDG
jgi:hypothetical protein